MALALPRPQGYAMYIQVLYVLVVAVYVIAVVRPLACWRAASGTPLAVQRIRGESTQLGAWRLLDYMWTTKLSPFPCSCPAGHCSTGKWDLRHIPCCLNKSPK